MKLFENCLPFDESTDLIVPVDGLKLPAMSETPSTDRWVNLITKEAIEQKNALAVSKDSGESKPAGTLKTFLVLAQKNMELNPLLTSFWFETIKDHWLLYFYPEIYFHHFATKFSVVPDPSSIGYHPFCPPVVHVYVSTS